MPVPAQNNIDQDDGSTKDVDEDPEKIQKIKPIAQRRFIGEDIADIKWAFNDTFILVVTVSNKLFILDSLCHAFNVILPQ